MRFPCFLLAVGLSFSSVQAAIVRPAPEFFWRGIGGSSISLSETARQPVVLIIAPSARSGAFKKQLGEIETLYRQYAGRGTLFCAAFTEKQTNVRTNIPFLYVQDATAIAAQYGQGRRGFRIAIIGPDRNLDLISSEVLNAEQLRDVIDNSFAQQSVRRAGQ